MSVDKCTVFHPLISFNRLFTRIKQLKKEVWATRRRRGEWSSLEIQIDWGSEKGLVNQKVATSTETIRDDLSVDKAEKLSQWVSIDWIRFSDQPDIPWQQSDEIEMEAIKWGSKAWDQHATHTCKLRNCCLLILFIVSIFHCNTQLYLEISQPPAVYRKREK